MTTPTSEKIIIEAENYVENFANTLPNIRPKIAKDGEGYAEKKCKKILATLNQRGTPKNE